MAGWDNGDSGEFEERGKKGVNIGADGSGSLKNHLDAATEVERGGGGHRVGREGGVLGGGGGHHPKMDQRWWDGATEIAEKVMGEERGVEV